MARLEGLLGLLGGAAMVMLGGYRGHIATATARLESVGKRRHLDFTVLSARVLGLRRRDTPLIFVFAYRYR